MRLERIADGIIAYRDGLMDGMQSIAELTKIESVDIKTFKKIAKYITTRSNVYTVRSLATAQSEAEEGAKLLTEAVVDRSSTPYRTLYHYQGVTN